MAANRTTPGQRREVVFGWVLLGASGACWPLSMLTFAKNEPPTVLSLSWIALILAALSYLKTARVHRDQ